MSKTQNGFTLIELIIVIAILGLLSTVGLINFRASQVKGRDAQRKSNLAQLGRALELYYNDAKTYPASLASLNTGETIYIKEIPKDPLGVAYVYELVNSGKSYKIYARLENALDKDYYLYTGTDCGSGNLCTYVVSSSDLKTARCQGSGVTCTSGTECCSGSCNGTTHACN